VAAYGARAAGGGEAADHWACVNWSTGTAQPQGENSPPWGLFAAVSAS
jgi:hypothetical protein